METTLNRDLTGGDVPPFSYTGIAHTFKNSPFNEYPYAMARLRWFSDSFDSGHEPMGSDSDLSRLRSALLERATANGHFTYLHVSDAGFVDVVLDELFRDVEPGGRRDAHELGPHEPGIGRWVNDDEFNERHTIHLPSVVSRVDLHDRVLDRLRAQRTAGAAVDEIYLYPPDYGDEPEREVRHVFRIFAHSEPREPASSMAAGARLRAAAETVLSEISQLKT